jgi:two-component system response regulator FlrC
MRILVVGARGGLAEEAARIAKGQGADMLFAAGAGEALSALRAGNAVELVMADVASDVPGLIRGMVEERLIVPVVAFGTENDAAAAVAAVKAGARDYVPLPPSEDVIAALLGDLGREERGDASFVSAAMKAVFDVCRRVAPSAATVLITGESGTGKEVAARHIHRHSDRRDRPMVSVNCAAIPEALLETELFGHEKGAFTGAVARRVGKFEEAHRSTLLLDEVSEMAPSLQAKLLRAVQEREIDRVGGKSAVKVDVRILATSNRNLWEYVQEGHFREDLYYRLNVIPVRIPPLRERPEDVAHLAKHFAKKYAELNRARASRLTPSALAALERHSWPGNVRELENAIHRAVLMAAGDEITEADLLLPAWKAPDAVPAPPESRPSLAGKTVAETERELILQTMERCYGNRAKAADLLGISIRTLRNKLKEYGGAG